MSKNDKAAVVLLNVLFELASRLNIVDIKYQIMTIIRAGYNFKVTDSDVQYFNEKSQDAYSKLEGNYSVQEVSYICLYFSILYLEHTKGIRAHLWSQLSKLIQSRDIGFPNCKTVRAIDCINDYIESIRKK